MSAPFWGDVTSTVDWCEANYHASRFIAEMWNTVSSFAMVAAGVLGLVRHRSLPFFFRFAFGLLVLVGLGSAAFHASLRYEAQLFDEVPMVCLVLVMVFILTGARRLWPFAAAAAVFTLFASGARGQLQFYAFHISFGALELFALAKTFLLQRDAPPPVKRRYRWGMLAYAVGVLVWFTDNTICSTLGDLKLHALWHVLVSYGFYALILVIAAQLGFALRPTGHATPVPPTPQ